MAVQAIKGVEIGLGFEAARRRGSQVHDPIQSTIRPGRQAGRWATRGRRTTPAAWRPA